MARIWCLAFLNVALAGQVHGFHRAPNPCEESAFQEGVSVLF